MNRQNTEHIKPIQGGLPRFQVQYLYQGKQGNGLASTIALDISVLYECIQEIHKNSLASPPNLKKEYQHLISSTDSALPAPGCGWSLTQRDVQENPRRETKDTLKWVPFISILKSLGARFSEAQPETPAPGRWTC